MLQASVTSLCTLKSYMAHENWCRVKNKTQDGTAINSDAKHDIM